MNISKSAAHILERLEAAGFEAYVVGGCVRDSLMGVEPKDWDICTSARPDQVKAALPGLRILDTGIKHGTVTVLDGAEACEVTTFRVDGEYADSRRPESVEFTGDLTLDLARRDFTVNAMAFSPKRGLCDPFGGRGDVERRLIRAVGEPRLRFGEDALRVLRGVRFAAALNFEVEDGTAAAMLGERALLQNISAERRRDELLKALQSGNVRPAFTRFREVVAEVVPELRPCFDFEQHSVHHCYDVYTHILTAVDSYTGSDPAVKAALLLHDAAKPLRFKLKDGTGHFKGHPAAGAKIAMTALRRLKWDNASIEKAVSLVRFHDVRLTGGLPQARRLTFLLGEGLMYDLLDVMRADALAQSEFKRGEKLALIEGGRENLRRIIDEGLCHELRTLAVDGKDAAALGLEGRQIGAALHYCLNGVMCGRVENRRAALTAYMEDFRNIITGRGL